MRENFTSSSYGEGLKTDRRAPRQSLTRQTVLDEPKPSRRAYRTSKQNARTGAARVLFPPAGPPRHKGIDAPSGTGQTSLRGASHSFTPYAWSAGSDHAGPPPPPRDRKRLHHSILEEIFQERVKPNRYRWNPRGVKRKMSSDALRPDAPPSGTSPLFVSNSTT